jgi:polyisoprenoid-binding protein YceI
MRPSVLAVIALLSVHACSSRDAAPARATSMAPEKPSASAPAPAVPQTSKWELDPENSSVEFVCKHAAFTNVRGMFQKPSGTVTLDDATPANSKLNATIDVKSISTGVEERDTHLKSPEFFDAAKYPVITFVSTSFTNSNDASFSMTGNLTMHGVTKPVTLAVRASPPFQHFGSIRRGIEATTSVNRQDFGVGVAAWNVPAESGGLLIGNNVKITIDAELVLQAEPGKGG